MLGNNRRKSQHRRDDLSGYMFKGEIQSSDTLIIGEKGVVKRTSTSAAC